MMVPARLSLAFTLGLSLLPAASGRAAEPLVPESPRTICLSNQEMAEAIAARLQQSGQLQNYDVYVRFWEGAAELTGSVADVEQHHRVMRLVQDVPGVRRVIDRLSVAGAVVPVKAGGIPTALPPVQGTNPAPPALRAAPAVLPPVQGTIPVPPARQAAPAVLPPVQGTIPVPPARQAAPAVPLPPAAAATAVSVVPAPVATPIFEHWQQAPQSGKSVGEPGFEVRLPLSCGCCPPCCQINARRHRYAIASLLCSQHRRRCERCQSLPFLQRLLLLRRNHRLLGASCSVECPGAGGISILTCPTPAQLSDSSVYNPVDARIPNPQDGSIEIGVYPVEEVLAVRELIGEVASLPENVADGQPNHWLILDDDDQLVPSFTLGFGLGCPAERNTGEAEGEIGHVRFENIALDHAVFPSSVRNWWRVSGVKKRLIPH